MPAGGQFPPEAEIFGRYWDRNPDSPFCMGFLFGVLVLFGCFGVVCFAKGLWISSFSFLPPLPLLPLPSFLSLPSLSPFLLFLPLSFLVPSPLSCLPFCSPLFPPSLLPPPLLSFARSLTSLFSARPFSLFFPLLVSPLSFSRPAGRTGEEERDSSPRRRKRAAGSRYAR